MGGIWRNRLRRFFEQLPQELDEDVHVVMFWDQAGFHTANAVAPPANVTLIPLPPYAPELNPIENLWHYLRSHHWSNPRYADYDTLREAACEAWQKSCLNADIIKTVYRAEYLDNCEIKTGPVLGMISVVSGANRSRPNPHCADPVPRRA